MIEGLPDYRHRDVVTNIIVMLLSTSEKVLHALETPGGRNKHNSAIGIKH